MPEKLFYNTQHSPIGAFSSFTLGFKGNRGGLGLELDKPADENVYIGLQSRDGSVYEALPFLQPHRTKAPATMWRKRIKNGAAARCLYRSRYYA
ncbi:glycoside hydrolase family 52 protein [Paenibacillus farraposensis]|uniref:glycoside hydrolase family 52 protein n=1 Tax=Paenibacillus farraposensis TaxID=2807095 RepID=UPI0036216F8B